MIYIATIHWKTPKWIKVQYDYLKRFMTEEYRVYTSLDKIGEKYKKYFDYVLPVFMKDHGVKLNMLAEKIMESAADNDIIIFLDGDAFPIGDVVDYLREKLKKYPLMAIQRKENLGDIVPHPAFCATTIKFWKEVKGDWQRGYKYINDLNMEITDVGGNLFERLYIKQTDWYPLLRSNRKDLHPLFFGIYDSIIYHHGSGFRLPISSVDKIEIKFRNEMKLMKELKSANSFFERVIKKIKFVIYRNIFLRLVYLDKEIYNRRMNKKIFRQILKDAFFFRQFN